MFKYTIFFEEGDFTNDVSFFHEEKFSEEEFQKICENAVLYSFKKDILQRNMFFVSSVNIAVVYEYLKNFGFKCEEFQFSYQQYYFDGFYPDKIKNEELKDLIVNKKKYVNED